MKKLACLLLFLTLATPAFAQPADAPPDIDWNKARQLYQREQRGEKLSPEDQANLDRAKALRQRQNPQQRGPAPTPRESTGLVPLTSGGDATYKGQSPGLYGNGQNQPPADHLRRAAEAAASIRPLSAEGKPDPSGKIVLMSMGMSNTTQEFSRFVQIASENSQKNRALVIVDAAQGGQDADAWVNPQRRERVWQTAEQRLTSAGVKAAQVQVLWIKQAIAGPARLGDFPKHAEVLRDDVASAIVMAKQRFPNLKLVYLSSRTYAGWAKTPLNPEPYAYEGAFAMRWVIDSQIKGDNKELAYDKAPVILWGPYLWTDGVKGRSSDKLVWTQEDVAADGTHPGNPGRTKVAEQLLQFFTTDHTAKPWFLAAAGR